MIKGLIWLTGLVVWVFVIAAVVLYIRSKNRMLCRSSVNRKILGVCGGIGESLGVDPVVVRIIWLLTVLFGGGGIVAYIIAAIVMPKKIDEIEYHSGNESGRRGK